MNKKKLLLAVLLFAALIFAGIILPLILKRGASPSTKSKGTQAQTQELPQGKTELPKVKCLNFDALKDFMADTKITELESLFPQYLQSAGKTDITSASFLSDQSSYPSSSEVRLMFELSDETALPVYCDRDGRFLFGEERTQLSQDTKAYQKQTDEKLPKLSAEEIEKLQEGGYQDTPSSKKPTGQEKGE